MTGSERFNLPGSMSRLLLDAFCSNLAVKHGIVFAALFSRFCLAQKFKNLRWPNTVFARAFAAHAQRFQRTNMPSIERSFYLLNTRTICVIFLYNLTQCIDGFSLITKIC